MKTFKHHKFWRGGGGSPGSGDAELPIGLNSIKYNATPPTRSALEAALGITLENYYLTEREIRFTNIGYIIPVDAFTGDNTITNIYLQAATAGANAFIACQSLQSVNMPLCISWGASCFQDCIGLTEVYGSIAQTLAGSCFAGCANLIRANFPVVTFVDESGFQDCPVLQYANIPSATSLGNNCFSGAASLLEANFPKADFIGNNCFFGCSALDTVNLDSATSIGTGAFQNDVLLANVTMPFATSLGDDCFNGCSALGKISLPFVKTIGARAFQDCIVLSYINIPLCVNLGGSTGDDDVFLNINGLTVICPVSLRTANAGAPDGDLVYVINHVGIINYVNGVIVGSIKVSLSAAQIQTGNSIPIVVSLPAPGAGKYLFASSAQAKFSVGGTPGIFANLCIGNTSIIDLLTGKFHSLIGYGGGFTGGSNCFSGSIAGVETSAVAIATNDTLSIMLDNDSPGQTGTMDIYIDYKIVTL